MNLILNIAHCCNQESTGSGPRSTSRGRGLSILPTFTAVLLLLIQSSTTPANAYTAGYDQMDENCQDQIFPITAGGTGEEYVSCTVLDEQNNFIIVGGNTTSADFGPAPAPSGFLYAVDMDGSWQWGNVFFNNSQHFINNVAGCQISDNGNILVTGDASERKAIMIMEVDPSNGTVQHFVFLDPMEPDEELGDTFKNFGAVYHDIEDESDGKQYYYTSFVHNDKMQLLKVNRDTGEVEWGQQYYSDDAGENLKLPNFLHQHQREKDQMFLIGQFNARASVTSFSKRSMHVDWSLEITTATGEDSPKSLMNEIVSYVQPKNKDSIYACGLAWTRPEDADPYPEATDPFKVEGSRAAMLRMTDEGEVKYLLTWGEGRNAPGPGSEMLDVDQCRAIAYDYENGELVMVVETTYSPMRPNLDKQLDHEFKSDLVILRIRESGDLQAGYNINMYDAGIAMMVGQNSAFVYDNYYIFGGQSIGFKTRKAEHIYEDEDLANKDSYLFKYDPSGDSGCFYGGELDASELSGILRAELQDDGEAISQVTHDSGLFNQMARKFQGYAVPAEQIEGFPTLSTIKVPKMCADYSEEAQNIPQYYRGQNQISLTAIDLQIDGATAELSNGQSWIFENGTLADEAIGTYEPFTDGGTFHIYTNDTDYEGQQHNTILRGCSHRNELVEIFVKIEVAKNTLPIFAKQLQKSFMVDLDVVTEYELPPIKDKEGNDEVEVFVEPRDDKEWPPYLFFDNVFNTLIFRPDSVYYQGRTTYFNIILKEKNSDVMQNVFACTVTCSGEIIDPMTYLNFTDIRFRVVEITEQSTGALLFEHPVNLTFIAENWDSIFEVYIKNNSYREHNTTMDVVDFEITHLREDNRQINFTVQFSEQQIKLKLKKITDKFYIHMRWDLLDNSGFIREDRDFYRGMVLGNYSETRFWPDKCERDQIGRQSEDGNETLESYEAREQLYATATIPLQFDFRDAELRYMRQFAEQTYWYLCYFLAFQFVVLLLRGATFLPLWTLCEYMQMAAFLPLFNFTLIPYMYDTFKPFLVAHLVMSDEPYVLKDMAGDYFNDNWRYYQLSVAKLGQAFGLYVAAFGVVIAVNILLFLLSCALPKGSRLSQVVNKQLGQFRYNAYIRFYMLAYYDTTFFAVMKLVEGDDSTDLRKMASLGSLVVIGLALLLPFAFAVLICKRAPFLKVKSVKKPFNALLLKLDKARRVRLAPPIYFFARRFATAVMICMPIDSKLIFVQYIVVVVISHAWLVYLFAMQPYQSPLLNYFQMCNESVYVLLCVSTLIFSDSEPDLNIKRISSVVVFCTICALILNNFLLVLILIYKGPEGLKKDIKIAKQRRADAEYLAELERQEKEEQHGFLPRKGDDEVPEGQIGVNEVFFAEEAEFIDDDQKTTTGDQVGARGGKIKKKKTKRNKTKNNDDSVQEAILGGTSRSRNDGDFDDVVLTGFASGSVISKSSKRASKTKADKSSDAGKIRIGKKSKRRRDKNKNKQDDLAEASMGSDARSSAFNKSRTSAFKETSRSAFGGASALNLSQSSFRQSRQGADSKPEMESGAGGSQEGPPEDDYEISSDNNEKDEPEGKKTKGTSDSKKQGTSSSSDKKSKKSRDEEGENKGNTRKDEEDSA